MEDLFKKFVYTGIGLVSLTAEKLQKSVDSLVADRKISRETGNKIVDDVLKKTEARREEFEKQLKKVSEEVIGKFNYPKTKEVEDLRRRVAVLEQEMDRVKGKKKKVAKPAKAPEGKKPGRGKGTKKPA